MTLKQILLSTLFLSATGNIALGMEKTETKNLYEFPELPSLQCDFCKISKKQYIKEYTYATERLLKDVSKKTKPYDSEYSQETNAIIQTILPVLADQLMENLTIIQKKQKLCSPEEIAAAKINRKKEGFANFIAQLNHEQQ